MDSRQLSSCGSETPSRMVGTYSLTRSAVSPLIRRRKMSHSPYDKLLVRPLVPLRDQRLQREHGEDDRPQHDRRENHERDLQELARDLLAPGEVVEHPPAGVHDLLLPAELRARDLDGADAAHVPADAEVDLLDLPVLEEDGAPGAGEDGVCEGVLGEELPGEEAGYGGEGEEDDVGLDEGKVEGDLGL